MTKTSARVSVVVGYGLETLPEMRSSRVGGALPGLPAQL